MTRKELTDVFPHPAIIAWTLGNMGADGNARRVSFTFEPNVKGLDN